VLRCTARPLAHPHVLLLCTGQGSHWGPEYLGATLRKAFPHLKHICTLDWPRGCIHAIFLLFRFSLLEHAPRCPSSRLKNIKYAACLGYQIHEGSRGHSQDISQRFRFGRHQYCHAQCMGHPTKKSHGALCQMRIGKVFVKLPVLALLSLTEALLRTHYKHTTMTSMASLTSMQRQLRPTTASPEEMLGR
jgi:hypothetical protein